MTPATRKQIIALGKHHARMEAMSTLAPEIAERDADRSYVARAVEARAYHGAVAQALRNHLRENP